MREGGNVVLPLISAYGTERLWIEPDPPRKERAGTNLRRKDRPSRLNGYSNIQFLIHEEALFDWIETETLASLQNGTESTVFRVVKNAIIGCIDDATDLYYDVQRKEVVVVMRKHGPHPYELLSDGQRAMLTLVGDIAKKAITLNPHLNENVLDRTPGVVTIDELDLHLDPKWQRRVIRDLKRTFPAIQFIAATHSPQLIGEAEPQEIILLALAEAGLLGNHQPSNPAQSFGMDSNWILKHVMGADERDEAVRGEFEEVDCLIGNLKLTEAQSAVDKLRNDIGNHPELVRLSARIDRLAKASR
jgi:predicted ATP-binding protein involved in virulence